MKLITIHFQTGKTALHIKTTELYPTKKCFPWNESWVLKNSFELIKKITYEYNVIKLEVLNNILRHVYTSPFIIDYNYKQKND